MPIVPVAPAAPLPTNVAPLPRLFAYAQTLGLERYLHRPKRGLPTLALALLWLVLAWRGSGRPQHLADLDEPLLAALLGCQRLPDPVGCQNSRTAGRADINRVRRIMRHPPACPSAPADAVASPCLRGRASLDRPVMAG